MWEVRRYRRRREEEGGYCSLLECKTRVVVQRESSELARLDLEAERGGGCDITLQGWFVRVESSPATIYHLIISPSTIYHLIIEPSTIYHLPSNHITIYHLPSHHITITPYLSIWGEVRHLATLHLIIIFHYVVWWCGGNGPPLCLLTSFFVMKDFEV